MGKATRIRQQNARERIAAQRAAARRAETELRAGHVRGPLHGIPYGAKDLFATGGGLPPGLGVPPFPRPTLPPRGPRHPGAARATHPPAR